MIGERLSLAAVVLALAHAAPVSAQIVGACRFDGAALAFAGDAQTQAACLLRHVGPGGVVDAHPARLPAALNARLGKPVEIPLDRLGRYLDAEGVAGLKDHLADPVSRARDGDPAALLARYFVIHDTSEPYLGVEPFPPDLDRSDRINDLAHYAKSDAVAHLFINRRGEMLVGHDWSVPWRATKLESKLVGLPAKGLFLHVENGQPRRADPAGPVGNDRIAPVPGLSAAQYDRLALAYVVASFRAGQWLIPAFHAAIDEGVPDAHDDPQNFDLAAFDAAVVKHLAALARVDGAAP